MLEGIEFLDISLGNPNEMTAKAIQRVRSFAEENNPDPVVVKFCDVDPNDLLSEGGEPANKDIKMALDMRKRGILVDFSFRYLRDLDLSLFPIEHIY